MIIVYFHNSHHVALYTLEVEGQARKERMKRDRHTETGTTEKINMMSVKTEKRYEAMKTVITDALLEHP